MKIAKRLLQHGADVNLISQSDRMPPLIAIKNHTPEIVARLLRYDADKEVPDRSGATPVKLAQGSEQITALLREPQFLQGPMPVNREAPQKHSRLVTSARTSRDSRDRVIALLDQPMPVYPLLYRS
ncbi:hypothetical protein SAMD00023353_12200070 [Rosellinia necatrix]|uniref:Uncharacterized protein n=1 Tax=Rosellinia necatrix TaxID=77044 RepID=A0A1W2TXL1_ROSNE|nr:hypothetical protein SAMD00023353_12200070 [Rosellinia necatrix]